MVPVPKSSTGTMMQWESGTGPTQTGTGTNRQRGTGTGTSQIGTGTTDELKSHPFLVHFSDMFLSKKE